MNYRDLINALMLMGEPDRAKINACMEGKHSMTRLAHEIELLIESYQHRRLEGQQATTKSELLQDDEFKECFETAISEQAAYIFEHCGMPLQATEALFRVLQDECNEHIADGGVCGDDDCTRHNLHNRWRHTSRARTGERGQG